MLASKGHGLIVIISKKFFLEVIRVIGCRTVLCIFSLDTGQYRSHKRWLVL